MDIQDSGGMYNVSPLFISNLNPVASNPFRKRDGASRSAPIALVSCLNVINPRSASSISHLTNTVMYFDTGNFNMSGKTLVHIKIFGKKYKKNDKINTIYIKLFLKLSRDNIAPIFFTDLT